MIKIYSLFYSDSSSIGRALENGNNATKDTREIYLKNAYLLQRSLAEVGFDHQVLTNDGSAFDDFSQNYGCDISYIELPFTWEIPRNIKFYGAHYKLEAFHHIGSGSLGEKILFIDLDMVATPSFPALIKVMDTLDSKSILYYDVSPIELTDDLLNDHCQAIEFLSGKKLVEPIWAGGEFIFASAAGFRALSESSLELMPNYFHNSETMPHVGDEMVLNSVINFLVAEWDFVEVGCLLAGNPVVRFWSAGTAKKLNGFSKYTGVSLYHFPADKEFIGRHFNQPYDFLEFIQKYKKMLLIKSISRHIYYLMLKVLGLKRYAPKL